MLFNHARIERQQVVHLICGYLGLNEKPRWKPGPGAELYFFLPFFLFFLPALSFFPFLFFLPFLPMIFSWLNPDPGFQLYDLHSE